MDSGEHLGEIDTFQGGRLEIERQPPESEKCCFEKKRNMVKEKIREIPLNANSISHSLLNWICGAVPLHSIFK